MGEGKAAETARQVAETANGIVEMTTPTTEKPSEIRFRESCQPALSQFEGFGELPAPRKTGGV